MWILRRHCIPLDPTLDISPNFVKDLPPFFSLFFIKDDATILVHIFFTTDDLGRYENAIQVFRQ